MAQFKTKERAALQLGLCIGFLKNPDAKHAINFKRPKMGLMICHTCTCILFQTIEKESKMQLLSIFRQCFIDIMYSPY